MRRIAGGSRPAATAARSMIALLSIALIGGTYDIEGIQPSPILPARASAFGPTTPSQMPISWAGTGPPWAP